MPLAQKHLVSCNTQIEIYLKALNLLPELVAKPRKLDLHQTDPNFASLPLHFSFYN